MPLSNPRLAIMPGQSHSAQATCRRCGTCCLKGGPALHQEDLALVQKGLLSVRHLRTLRIREPVHDQILGRAILLEAECIKINARPGSSACIFFQPSDAACTFYVHRPLECRVLECWDTAALAHAARSPRLGRLDILGDSAMVELVREHEARCACAMLLDMLRQNTHQSREELRRARTYDAALRDVLVERGVEAGMLEFFLGRPLGLVIQGLARWLRLTQEN